MRNTVKIIVVLKVIYIFILILDGYKLPEGTEIGLFAYAIHRDPKIWTDPECFKPERFAEENNRIPFSFLPFCAGPRNCIGIYSYCTLIGDVSNSYISRTKICYVRNESDVL